MNSYPINYRAECQRERDQEMPMFTTVCRSELDKKKNRENSETRAGYWYPWVVPD